MVGPPSNANFVDGGKNPSKQKGSLPIPQVPIRLKNVWCGSPNGVMDPLRSGGDLNQLRSNNVAYLSSQFKQVTGMTPTEFKNLMGDEKLERRRGLDKIL